MSLIESKVLERSAAPPRVRVWWQVHGLRSPLHKFIAGLRRLVKAQRYVCGLMWSSERWLFYLCFGLGIAQGISVPLFSFALGAALEQAGNGRSALSTATVLMCVAVALMGVVPMLMQVLNRELVEWLFGRIQGALVAKVATLDPERFGEPKLKGLFQRLSMRLVWKLIEFSFSLYPLIKGTVGTFIAVALLAHGAPELLLLVGLCAVPAMAAEALFARRYFEVDDGCTNRIRSFWDGFHLSTTSASILFRQAVGAAESMAQNFQREVGTLVGVYRGCNQRFARWRVAAALAVQAGVGIALVTLIARYSAGALSIAETVLLVSAVSLLGSSLAEVAGALGQQVGLSLYVRDWLSFLETKPWVVRAKEAPILPECSRGISVELRDVTFAYATHAKEYHASGSARMVIKGISLDIRPGEKCALLAPNGSGKSTLSNLLAGLFRPRSGSILLGGVSLDRFDEHTLRQTVAYLPQDFARYSMPVDEYIGLGRGEAALDPERVRQAAKRSGAHEFIERWPQGYKTLLGSDYEGGESPSGGQLQKLVLAMMFYKNAPFMLLDEPTAAVDPESAREFWDHLFHECPGHTVIFSTHYLGAVRRADRIILLREGKIEDIGTHAELMQRSETYQRIFRSQADDFAA